MGGSGLKCGDCGMIVHKKCHKYLKKPCNVDKQRDLNGDVNGGFSREGSDKENGLAQKMGKVRIFVELKAAVFYIFCFFCFYLEFFRLPFLHFLPNRTLWQISSS